MYVTRKLRLGFWLAKKKIRMDSGMARIHSEILKNYLKSRCILPVNYA